MTGPEAFFIAGKAGPLFALHYPAMARPVRAVLVIPPFAEELNKSRRMLALAARGLQAAGLDVLVVDLHGTGDSAGDFSDASLECWRQDLQCAADWLARRGATTLDLLAVRGGALLLPDIEPPPGMTRGRVVLWQPMTSGSLLVTQFLRLRVAEEMTGAERVPGEPEPRARLQAEGRIEIAGYEITSRLAAELEAVTDPLAAARDWQAWHWLEVGAPGVTTPGPAAQRSVAALAALGARVEAQVLPGDPFWATPEIAVVPGLVDATVAALTGARA